MSTVPIEKASALPRFTGVYLFCDRHGHVLYVGKAKDIRRRVEQHAREGRAALSAAPDGSRRKKILMSSVRVVDWRPADTELEALLLEDQLIKAHHPPYNRRQNKFPRQVSIEIAAEGSTPTAGIADGPGAEGSYGPFPDRFYAERLLAVLDVRFGITPRSGGGLRAAAPRIDAASRFLRGYDDGLLRSLREELQRLSEGLDFERAARLRDEISFCEGFLRRQDFIREFTCGAMIVTDRAANPAPRHFLFRRGALAERAQGPVPGTWEEAPPVSGACPDEPGWILSERGLVVLAWLNAGAEQRSFRVLPAGRS